VTDIGSSTGRTAWARNLAAPIRSYLHAETGGAIVLAAAAVVALIWANVAPGLYDDLWGTDLAIVVGGHHLVTDLRGWVNEGLMTLFFLVVGLEAKRELDLGELRERRRLAIPVVASLGGMACAAAIYLALNAGGEHAHGWGAAVSTDTALALGGLALISGGRAIRLRVWLLTVVVIDDLAALVIIALGYTERVRVGYLALAVGLFGVLIALRWAPTAWRGPAAALVGLGVWLAMFESGVDAVIAGLAIGLVTTAYPPSRDDLEHSTELARSFREQPTPELAYSARASLTSAISMNERLQYRLHPWTSRVIVPLFALANAGIHIDGDLVSRAVRSPVTLGIVAGYLIGKPAGILMASWVATRRRFGGTRLTVTWPALWVGAASAGVGFTVSLLVASLAFEGPVLEEATLGVLVTAVASPLLTYTCGFVMRHLPDETRARQLSGVAETIVDLAVDVDPERDHVRGRADAPVTLLEYGDYECPYCGHAQPTITELLEHLPEELNYVFRHLPLTDVHRLAQTASEAAEAAAAQGVFWEMHDRLMQHQGELGLGQLEAHAEAIGLDVDRFAEDLRRRRHAPRIAEDVASADASGVSGTPTFFINGRRHQGVYDIDTLRAAIKAAVRSPLVTAGSR
jgi:Na+/H+ antiporter NhaA